MSKINQINYMRRLLANELLKTKNDHSEDEMIKACIISLVIDECKFVNHFNIKEDRSEGKTLRPLGDHTPLKDFDRLARGRAIEKDRLERLEIEMRLKWEEEQKAREEHVQEIEKEREKLAHDEMIAQRRARRDEHKEVINKMKSEVESEIETEAFVKSVDRKKFERARGVIRDAKIMIKEIYDR